MSNKNDANQEICEAESCKVKSCLKKICASICSSIRNLISNLISKIKGENNIIAVVNLSGVIGSVGKFESGININKVEPLLEKAFKFKKLKAVALSINSPGG